VGFGPLLSLVAAEVGLLVALLVLLLAWSPVSTLLAHRRRSRERAAWDALRSWKPGDPLAAVARTLDRCSLYSARRVLDSRAGRRAAAAGLSLSDVARTGSRLLLARRWSRSRLWWRRLAAAQLLALVGEEDQLPDLVRLLFDPHPAPASAALLAAERVARPELISPLLDLATGRATGPLSLKEHVQIVLTGFGKPVVQPMLRRFRDVESEDGLVALLQLAGLLGDDDLRPAIEAHLTDGGLEVRINAVRALAGLPKRGSLAPLLGALEDPAWQVRAQAASALGRLDAPTAAPDLLRALSDPSWWVRLRAGLALRRLGWKGDRLLESVSSEGDRYAYQMARYVLDLEEAALVEYAT